MQLIFNDIVEPDVGGTSTGLRRFAVTSLAVFLTLAGPVTANDGFQSHEEIERTAAETVERLLPASTHRREVAADKVDPRLRLSACDEPLEAELPAGFSRGRRMTVSVHCRGDRRWKIFVPVNVTEIDKVLVTTRSLQRGAIIGPQDVAAEERAVSGMPRGYLRARDPYRGMRLRRSVAAGQVLAPSLLEMQRIIARGQRVTLVARDGGLSVSMEGEALDNGALGQRIRVRNMSSRRELEGVVRSSQRVEVLLN